MSSFVVFDETLLIVKTSFLKLLVIESIFAEITLLLPIGWFILEPNAFKVAVTVSDPSRSSMSNVNECSF